MNLKVLFLDVDGVLNTWDTKDRAPNGCLGVDDQFVDRLAKVVQETGCKIVLSSTWRMHSDILPYLHRRLGQTISKCIIGSTPSFPAEPRGREIKFWLNKHPEVRSFAIVDDNDEMAEVAPHLVKTSMWTGLTEELANQLIAKLNHPI